MPAVLLLALLTCLEDPKREPPKGDNRPAAVLSFAKEHVPESLQPGEMVHIKIVAAVSVNKNERRMLLREFVRDAEVVKVDVAANPKEPWEAIIITMRVTPEQREQISNIQKTLITVKDSQTKKTSKRPLPLHVERAKKENK